ncbi:hypothetical protein EV586_102316 [Tumebacillus sp. BK434]|uniref:hypothetical protein n=1 Tax=Tumebacillus sp. BK434 TaxID=2512169 RepID=UPI001043A91F|nr:hypothetical protein [Tumebacillus sp. BK434]TCP57869.1 hypothetical protein EV586_102316 [Tumebacillus sp. BK434]
MQRLWWKLPGPAKYLRQLEEEFRAGNNTVLLFPDHTGDNPQEALRGLVEENGDTWLDWEYVNVRLEDSGTKSPAQLLYDRFVPSATTETIRNAENLAKDDSFCGKIVWVYGMTVERLSKWNEFIQEYSHFCKETRIFERSLFCIVLEGEQTTLAPGEAECLKIIKWEGVLSKLDMMLYVSNLLQDSSYNTLIRKMAVSVITEIAQWDRHVAERLAISNLETIMSPWDVLSRIAEERGWVSECSEDDRWQMGITQLIEGRTVIHSAYLVILGKETGLDRRVWEGQLATLFPYMEERRQALIRKFRDELAIPFRPHQDKDFVILDLFDLEIGHIYYQLRSQGQIREDIRDAVRNMREIRNMLAHLRTVKGGHLNLIARIYDLERMID